MLHCVYFSVSEKQTWQEVYQVKLKLDTLSSKVASLQLSSLSAPLLPRHTATPLQGSVTPSPPSCFAYSSLEEWNGLTACEFQRRLAAFEVELLSCCRRVLLQRVAQIRPEDRCVLLLSGSMSMCYNYIKFRQLLSALRTPHWNTMIHFQVGDLHTA